MITVSITLGDDTLTVEGVSALNDHNLQSLINWWAEHRLLTGTPEQNAKIQAMTTRLNLSTAELAAAERADKRPPKP